MRRSGEGGYEHTYYCPTCRSERAPGPNVLYHYGPDMLHPHYVHDLHFHPSCSVCAGEMHLRLKIKEDGVYEA